jgi:hypothetical protein
VTKEVLMNYVRKVFDEHEIDMKNVYNMDESGFTIGKISATRIIIDAELRTKYQAQPGRQEWVSVIECICTDGTSIRYFSRRKAVFDLDSGGYIYDLEVFLQYTRMDEQYPRIGMAATLF